MARKKKQTAAPSIAGALTKVEADENALVVLPGATSVSLTIPSDTSIEKWIALAKYMKTMEGGLHWWIGDLLLFAESQGKEYSEQAVQAVSDMGFAPHTLQNATSVARRFPKERRRGDLTFTHHSVVAYMESPKKADDLLAMAVTQNWSVSSLKEAVREQEAKKVRGRSKATEPVTEPVPANPLHVDRSTASDVKEAQATEIAAKTAERAALSGAEPNEAAGVVDPPVDTYPVTQEDFDGEMLPLCARAAGVLSDTLDVLAKPSRDKIDALNKSASAGRDVLIEVCEKAEEFGAEAL